MENEDLEMMEVEVVGGGFPDPEAEVHEEMTLDPQEGMREEDQGQSYQNFSENVNAELTIPVEMSFQGSIEPSPVGSPTADVSRAGRKRKANTRYMDEPSPVVKPVVRKSSTGGQKKSAPVPPPPPPVKEVKPKGSAKQEEELVVTGPPTFGSLLFGGRSRKLSDSLSDLDLNEDEDNLGSVVSEDELEPVVVEEKPVVSESAGEGVKPQTPGLMIGAGKKLEGTYVASGVVGPTVHGMIKPPLVPPSGESSLKFPDLSSDEFQASLPPKVSVPVELGGGGILGLIPSAPLTWYRDEIPKLSAYFRKKMEASSGLPVARPSVTGEKPMPISAAEKKLREERKRQKEEERKRLIEDRNRRRERERLKQLYRQHWLALTKFPIEDDLLHSHKGIRRLGHPLPQCRVVASPAVFWDCRLGPPESLEFPSNVSTGVTELVDEIFVIWNFFIHFGPFLGGEKFTLPQLVEGVFTKQLTPLIQSVFQTLLLTLRPWTEFQLTTLLQSEQALESQLTKNRGRAKLHWSSLCQFRDLLFLGYSVFINKSAQTHGPDVLWLWEALFVAKTAVLTDSIDYKTKEFLGTISAAFEEIDFEHKWIFDWELNRNWTFEQIPFEYRVKILKLLVDRIVALPVVKKSVDLWCEGRTHISAEIAALEKEERKITQRVTLCQKLQALIAQAPGEASNIQLPMTEEELAQDIAFRDALIRSKKTCCVYFDTELAVRLESLGRDRHLNEYFQISADRRLVFVRQHSVSHPNVVRYGIYDSLANLEQLIQSLDERGVRELSLRTELQKIKASQYQELSARGETKFDKMSIDWLGNGRHDHTDLTDSLEQLEADAGKFQQLKFVKECVIGAKSGFEKIKKAWRGKIVVDEMGDDVTVDEDMEEDVPPPETPESEASRMEISETEFVGEIESFHQSIVALSDMLTECITNSLLGYPRPDETTATTSSILIQFHIKTGSDLLRHLSIPVGETEFRKLIESVDPANAKSILNVASVFLDGLEALDEIIHDEIARHEATSGSIEIWPATGGEKHAWKKFISGRTWEVLRGTESPPGETEEDQPTPEDEEEDKQNGNTFGCEVCGKKFKFHILLGVHKLHPCKTRGRKPIPVDPIMEVLPVALNNGVLAVEKVNGVEFPPLPSSRQEAAERAEKAERAAAAAAAAAAAPEGGESASIAATTTAEYICDICGKVFPHNQGLAVHQTRWCIPEQQAQLLLTAQQAVGGGPAVPAQPEEGPVNCPTCGKLFPTVQGLNIHQTRWCKGPEQADVKSEGQTAEEEKKAAAEAIKTIHVDPVFRKEAIPSEQLVKVEEPISVDNTVDDDSKREPGFTPACYSMAALSVAILWYKNKVETALRKFTSDRSHHSRSGSAKSNAAKSRR